MTCDPHNLTFTLPAAIVLQTKADGSQLWALFHIGDGTGGSTQNCTHGDSAVASPVSPAGGSTLHVASSPNGPFTPAQPLPSCNNPAPASPPAECVARRRAHSR